MSDTFRHVISLDQISDIPQHVELAPTAAERAAIAERLQLPAIASLKAALDVHATARGISVVGQLVAHFDYACRVTREPFAAELTEPVHVLFTTEELPDPTSENYVQAGVELLPLEHQGVDLAELVVESLALALDPYPRGPSADAALVALGILTEEQAQAQSSPFAALQGHVGSDRS